MALDLAEKVGGVTRAQLAAACGISGESARQVLHALVQRDELHRVGRGRAIRYVAPYLRS
jgi:predicted ArsR family transcriptional regulator